MTHEPLQLKPGRIGHLPPKTPCNECPMRLDSVPGALGGWTPEMYVEALIGPPDIACHLSKGFHASGGCGDPEDQKSCAGVAAIRVNCGLIGAHPKSSARAAMQAVADTPTTGLCFKSLEDFYAHHKGETA